MGGVRALPPLLAQQLALLDPIEKGVEEPRLRTAGDELRA
jgi:hypothetical protein